MPRGLPARIERIERQQKPAHPAWQEALERSEELWRSIQAKFQACLDECYPPDLYPDGPPMVDPATMTPEERAEVDALIRELREDCERAAATLRRA